MTIKLILNSTSTGRRTLLNRLNVAYIAASPNVDETPKPGESITDIVQRLACEKAMACAEQHHPALVIGCDQLLECDGQIMGKPNDHAAAVQQLKFASGKTMRSYTGLAVYNTVTQYCQSVVEPFDVLMRKLDSTTIENYLHKEKPYHCAGSLKAEGLGIALIAKMTGDDPNALTGLPLIKLTDLLAAQGFKFI